MTHHRFIYYSLQYPEFLDILKSADNCDFVLDTYYELCRSSITAISKQPAVKNEKQTPQTRTPQIRVNGLAQADSQSQFSKTDQSPAKDLSEQSQGVNSNDVANNNLEETGDKEKDSKTATSQNLDQIPEEKEPEETESTAREEKLEPESTKKDSKPPRFGKGKTLTSQGARKAVAWKNTVKDNSKVEKDSSNVTIRERSQNNLKAPKVKRAEGRKHECLSCLLVKKKSSVD